VMDMSGTIVAKSDQLNSDDLIGRSITIRITNVTAVPGDQPIAISYEGDEGKPWKPCKSMRRVLVHVWGLDGKAYIGRSLTLYRDPDVKFGGIAVGGIRISHMSDLASGVQIALTERKGSKKPFVVKPLAAAKPSVKKELQEETAAVPGHLVDLDDIKETAGKVAMRGTEALREWFEELTKDEKIALKPSMPGLKAEAAKKDAARVAVPLEESDA
jgi:hypothetical protein